MMRHDGNKVPKLAQKVLCTAQMHIPPISLFRFQFNEYGREVGHLEVWWQPDETESQPAGGLQVAEKDAWSSWFSEKPYFGKSELYR